MVTGISYLSLNWNSNIIFRYFCLETYICYFLSLAFVIFVAASWIHPLGTCHLSGRWTCLSGFYKLPENWSSSNWERSVGVEISGTPKVQGQVSTVGVVRHYHKSVPISAGSAKRRDVWRCPDERRYPSDYSVPDAFHRLTRLIYPVRNRTCVNSTFDFSEADRNKSFLIPPHTRPSFP